MRLFLAQSATLYEYEDLQASLSHCFVGRWRTPASLHATVLFLGGRLAADEIITAVKATRYTLDDAPLDYLGLFQRNRILYAGSEHPSLTDTHQKLSKMLEVAPQHHFVPHVTLMRYKETDLACFTTQQNRYADTTIGRLEGPLRLLKSTLTPEGAVYETLYSF